jgi:5'-phosphate synthase pdxT subunit
MTFIRAPRIRTVGPGVRVLGRHAGAPVLVREGTVLAATFHPELSDDLAVHQYFCAMAQGQATRPVIASTVPRSL